MADQGYVAIAVDWRGRIQGEWTGPTVSAAMAAADQHSNAAYVVTVRWDRTSDGTIFGKGKGRVEAVRENGRWQVYMHPKR